MHPAPRPRTILVHDFAGHPFPTELSRALAADGDVVVHAFSSGVAAGHGDLTIRPDDPADLRFVDLHPETFERYGLGGRLKGELRYGQRLARLTDIVQPEVVLSANTPLLIQARLWMASKRSGATRVYWLQDFLGLGTRITLEARSPLLGVTVGRAFERLEKALLRRSEGIIVISEDFLPAIRACGVDDRVPVAVVENWASITEVTTGPKSNAWSRKHGFDQSLVALYSGTLGLKHDPGHLVRASRAIADLDATLVVITEGLGRDALEEQKREHALHNLDLRDLVAYDELPDVLASADLCLVLLEADAGAFSVPSKILNYLAAGRPIVAAMPSANLASRTVERAGAGIVVTPGDHEGFASAVRQLLGERDDREAMGRRARIYAEATFDIEKVKAKVRDLLDLAGTAPQH